MMKTETQKPDKEYYVGDIVKGHTYFIGDFHDKKTPNNKKSNLGMPKMRMGIILSKKSPYYKVQFQNSSIFNERYKNSVTYKTRDEIEHLLTGKDSYFIWIHVSKIKIFVEHSEIQNFPEILKIMNKKNSKNKKFVEQKINSFEFHQYSLEKKKYFLERKQFMNFEINSWMSDERAILKIKLLKKKLEKKRNTERLKEKICLRIIEAESWIKDQTLIDEKIDLAVKKAKKILNQLKLNGVLDKEEENEIS